MNPSELKNLRKVPVPTAEDLIKTIRILAMTGKKTFVKFLYEPLDFAGWKRNPAVDPAKRMMDRILHAAVDPGAMHTVGPLCKRLISQSLNETLSSLGDASIFFLERMTEITKVAISQEALDFVRAVDPPLSEFQDIQQNNSARLFAENLTTLSAAELKKAFAPVDLGRSQMKVQLQKEAAILFQKITVANRSNDLPRCRKMIAHYLVQFADQENNNMEEVKQLITAFQKRQDTFKADLDDFIAINLHYQIITAITQGNIRKGIQGIRKYAHIFQGNPDIRYYLEVDRMEQKLYEIITERGLWEELKKGD